MSNSKNQVMACGASAVIVDENGNTTTSIDMLSKGIKSLFSKESRSASRRTAQAHA